MDAAENGMENLESQLSELKRSKERFERLVESAPNGIVVANQKGEIVLVNETAEKLFGYGRGEFLGLTIEDLVPPRIRQTHHQNRDSFHAHPEVRQMGGGRDLFAVRKDGSEFAVEIGLTPLPGQDDMHVLSTIVDITGRKRIESELKQSRDSLRRQGKILKHVHDAVIFLSKSGEIIEWNNGASRIFGISAEEAIGSTIYQVWSHEGDHRFSDHILTLAKSNSEADEVIHSQRVTGETLVIRAKVTVMDGDDDTGYIICASDITKQKQLEAEVLRVCENEQRRIGQDLHDDLCSHLSGIGMMAKVMEERLKTSHEQEAKILGDIKIMVSDAGDKARSLAKGLVPSALETHGLCSAIRDMADQSSKLFGLECIVSVSGPEIVDSVSSTTGVQLYRIAQEATTNAMKHSDARQIQIQLSGESGKVLLEVSDDGKGFHPDMISSGLGMMTMRQRAEMINADFELHSFSGKGTRIICNLKLPSQPYAENFENRHCG